MIYTLSLPIQGGIAPTVADDPSQKTAEEFETLLDNVFEAGEGRIRHVVVSFEDGRVYAGVTFKNQDLDCESSFVFHGKYVSYGIHYRSDLFKLNEGFNSSNATVTKRKRAGGTFTEYVPGSRTFQSDWGWDLQPIFKALRAIDLAGPSLQRVADTNFGDFVEVVYDGESLVVTPL